MTDIAGLRAVRPTPTRLIRSVRRVARTRRSSSLTRPRDRCSLLGRARTAQRRALVARVSRAAAERSTRAALDRPRPRNGELRVRHALSWLQWQHGCVDAAAVRTWGHRSPRPADGSSHSPNPSSPNCTSNGAGKPPSGSRSARCGTTSGSSSPTRPGAPSTAAPTPTTGSTSSGKRKSVDCAYTTVGTPQRPRCWSSARSASAHGNDGTDLDGPRPALHAHGSRASP